MPEIVYYALCALLAAAVLAGISLQSRVKTAVAGNLLCVAALVLAVALAFYRVAPDATANRYLFIAAAVLVLSSAVALVWSGRIKMIEMPQAVALLNGIGGLASAIVGALELLSKSQSVFAEVTSALALAIGAATFTGSLIAAGKLAKIIDGRPVTFRGHGLAVAVFLVAALAGIVGAGFEIGRPIVAIVTAVSASAFGALFAIRVGGADMPITISLLNSLSGVASGVAGMAIYNVLLVAVGGIVGASGLLLTQIMCRAMNRSLVDIILGTTGAAKNVGSTAIEPEPEVKPQRDAIPIAQARDVIIIPGYGMALAQAQHLVKQLADRIQSNGGRVRYAIHPVAGRMPGHMNVLLCEAGVDYEQLYELESINGEFEKCDLVVIIGANDVVNPAARLAQDTPIYGMPILNADLAPSVIVCNFDTHPGYAGVENPLYSRTDGVRLLLGDATQSLQTLLGEF